MPGAVLMQFLAPATRGLKASLLACVDANKEAEMGEVAGRGVRKRQACRGVRP